MKAHEKHLAKAHEAMKKVEHHHKMAKEAMKHADAKEDKAMMKKSVKKDCLK